MKKIELGAVAAAIALVFSTGALAAQSMSKDEYKTSRDKIAAEYKAAKSGCASKTANAKDVCMAEARGTEKVARAELDARNKPGAKADVAVGMARAEAGNARGFAGRPVRPVRERANGVVPGRNGRDLQRPHQLMGTRGDVLHADAGHRQLFRDRIVRR